MPSRKITWTKKATGEFTSAIEHIRRDSEQNAEKVKEKILKKINQLEDETVVHRKDPYRKENDGNFLYFEILKHRITYNVQEGEVFIIRVRHTSREPKHF